MERGMRKEMTGVVVSDKMDKTRVIAIETWKTVPKYKKRVRSTRKVKAHDEGNSASVGDVVRIVESRPFSHDKKWRVAEILQKSRGAGGDQK
jgi:small subunit ribosomal protein S17